MQDLLCLACTHGVGGAVLTEAQSWPPVMQKHVQEMWRADPDGADAYSLEDRVRGAVVRSNEESGFWATRLVARGYPNPLLVKLAREVWEHFPGFLLLGECAWERERTLAVSGVLPRALSLPASLARVWGRVVRKAGEVVSEPGPGPEPVAALRRWLLWEERALSESERRFLVRAWQMRAAAGGRW